MAYEAHSVTIEQQSLAFTPENNQEIQSCLLCNCAVLN